MFEQYFSSSAEMRTFVQKVATSIIVWTLRGIAELDGGRGREMMIDNEAASTRSIYHFEW
jgi:hypothetical protein